MSAASYVAERLAFRHAYYTALDPANAPYVTDACRLNKPPKLYFAGPCDSSSRDRWGIVDDSYSTCDEPVPPERPGFWVGNQQTYPPIPVTIGDFKFQYTGPFFASCDHGCAHRFPHAALSFNCCDPSPEEWARVEPQIVARDLKAIDDSDAIFAWIPHEGCHGTIVEAGYAIGKGKPVFMGFKTRELLSTHWFVARMAKT